MSTLQFSNTFKQIDRETFTQSQTRYSLLTQQSSIQVVMTQRFLFGLRYWLSGILIFFTLSVL